MASTPLIYNPRSAGGRGGDIAKRARDVLSSRGVDVEPHATEGPGGASPLAERLAVAGAERILVVGGDGTFSEAADGVLRSKRGPEIGFLPAGTGNSFLHHFGVETLEDAADRIRAGKASAVDAALASWPGGERHFINVFGVGFAAKACDLANRRLKWMRGQAYNAAIFPELARLTSPMTRLTLDGRVVEEPLPLVFVCNTAYTGKGMKVAPDARADDGMLDVIGLRKVGRIGLLRIFPKIFDGSHVGLERILVARAREVRIEPAEPSPLLGDGEVFGTTPVTTRALPGALRALL